MPQLPHVLNHRRPTALAAACLLSCAATLVTPPPARAAAAAPPALEYLLTVPQAGAARLFANPLGIAVDPLRGRVFVADTAHNQVRVFTTAGVPLYSFKHRAKLYTGERALGEPWRLLPNDDGTLLVADRLCDRIDVVDILGNTVDSIDVTSLAGGPDRATPGAMDRDAAGNLYVLELTSGQVLVLDKAYRLRLRFGVEGSRTSRFRSVVDIAVARDGTTYALDSADDAVVRVFDPAGRPVRGFGRHGYKDANFHMPAAISIDAVGRLWIADAVSHEVKVYTTAGDYLCVFGGRGQGAGQFYFPSDLAVAADRLYVLERAGERFQEFRIVGP